MVTKYQTVRWIHNSHIVYKVIDNDRKEVICTCDDAAKALLVKKALTKFNEKS